jgi:hypothetical protein
MLGVKVPKDEHGGVPKDACSGASDAVVACWLVFVHVNTIHLCVLVLHCNGQL